MATLQHARARRIARAVCAGMIGFLVILLAFAPANAFGQGAPAKVRVDRARSRTDATGERPAPLLGTVVPARVSRVGSAVAGRVKEFAYNAGDRVEKGAALATLQTRQIDIQIAAARAEHNLRTQELVELQNKALPEEIEQVAARMEAARVLVEYSEKKLERTKSLVEKRAANVEQLQDDLSIAERARQSYIEAKAAHKLVIDGPRKERVAQAEARVESALEEVRRLEDQLEKHTIVAPFDGFVVAEHTEVGQWISQGELVAEVVEIAEVDVEVPVPESFVSRLRVKSKKTAATKATVEIMSLEGASFRGEVSAIVPQADLRSRNFPVKVRLENRDGADGLPVIKPGMLANVSFDVDGAEGAVLVAKDALKIEGRKRTVYVFDASQENPLQGVVRETPVELGAAVGDWIEVRGNLKAGELVVVEGNERLRAPWQVTLVAPPPVAPALVAPAPVAPATSDDKAADAPAESDGPADGETPDSAGGR